MEVLIPAEGNGLTQVDWAMYSGVGLSFVREWEQGKATVRMRVKLAGKGKFFYICRNAVEMKRLRGVIR